MSELHKFLFDGLPVRGMVVRLTDGWQEILQRRAANSTVGPYPQPVRDMLGEMVAAATLMQSNIKFDGSLVLQIMGSGPVKLAVVEVQSNRSLRATAKVVGEVPADTSLAELVNVSNAGRCVITLDPNNKFPGQQPYQGVVPLHDENSSGDETISTAIENYMRNSEQLDTTLVLAANADVAAGLLIQRLPAQGAGNLSGSTAALSAEELEKSEEDYQRIKVLASSLKREELLELDVETILHRLFWEESLLQFDPIVGEEAHHFACTCSRERVGRMIVSLGREEADSSITERQEIEVACDFCGQQYRFDAIDTAALFNGSMSNLTVQSDLSH